MANLVFNIAKGRVAELYNRVQTNDPANSAITIVVLAASGLETDATLLDKDTLSAVLSGSTNEVTNTGYSRANLTDSNLAAMSPDDTADKMVLDLPDVTWTSVQAGDQFAKILTVYTPSTVTSTDSNRVPLTMTDFVVTPNGGDITANITGFFEAD